MDYTFGAYIGIYMEYAK